MYILLNVFSNWMFGALLVAGFVLIGVAYSRFNIRFRLRVLALFAGLVLITFGGYGVGSSNMEAIWQKRLLELGTSTSQVESAIDKIEAQIPNIQKKTPSENYEADMKVESELQRILELIHKEQ